MLIKLSNGMWVDPKAVTAVSFDSRNDNRLFTIHLPGNSISCPPGGEIAYIVDDLAQFINGVLEEQKQEAKP